MSKTILAEVDGWTPAIDTITQEHDIMTSVVFGKVWRYCQMSDRVCTASQDRMAGELGISRATFNKFLGVLVDAGYLEDMTPRLIGLPHTYRDTGKAGLSISFTAQPVKNIDTPCQESVQVPVKNIDTKIVFKKQEETSSLTPDEGLNLDYFTARFGKCNSRAELDRVLALFRANGRDRMLEIFTWAEKQQIHLSNRSGLVGSLETAAARWTGKATRKPKGDRADFMKQLETA